ncbi:hypothetical protein DFJ73DRAFT_963474, partial [Zopfochytrium polystomum]
MSGAGVRAAPNLPSSPPPLSPLTPTVTPPPSRHHQQQQQQQRVHRRRRHHKQHHQQQQNRELQPAAPASLPTTTATALLAHKAARTAATAATADSACSACAASSPVTACGACRCPAPAPKDSAADAEPQKAPVVVVDDTSPLSAAGNVFDQLVPPELMVLVFRLVDAQTRCRCAMVNLRWRSVLYGASELWTFLDLSNRHTLGGEKFIETPGSPDSFQSKFLMLLSSVAPCMKTAPPLRGCATDPRGLDLGPRLRFSRLTRLDVSCTSFDPYVFESTPVGQMLGTTLTHLVMSGCPLVASGSPYFLRSLKSLISLDISHCEGVDDMGIEAVSTWVSWLQFLNLSYLFKITDASVRRLFRMSKLISVNLMGCCRIKSYFWAMNENGVTRSSSHVREISTGEDSRIQTRGFWLLWCTWQTWNMEKLGLVCPFLEVRYPARASELNNVCFTPLKTLRLNIVMLDFVPTGLDVLFASCKNLKNLSLVADRTVITALCAASESLRKLTSFELTIHIGVTTELIQALVDADAIQRLKALKFHSKHTSIFNDDLLSAFLTKAPIIEYFELNGEALSLNGLEHIPNRVGSTLQSLLVHHIEVNAASLRSFAPKCPNIRELTITDLQVEQQRTKRAPPALRPAKCKLSLLIPIGSPMAAKLKKVELLSHHGFSDADLSSIPKACPNLQWIDFTFNFTFPKTMAAIAKSCRNLLYLRLSRWSPPLWAMSHRYRPPSSAQGAATRAESTNRSQRPSSSLSSLATAISNSPSLLSPSLRNAVTTPSSPRSPGPFLASLYRASGRFPGDEVPTSQHFTPRESRSRRRDSECGKATGGAPASPAKGNGLPEPESSRVKPNSEIRGVNAQNAPTSPEAESFHALATGPAGKRLRVLDLAGPIGITDHVLVNSLSLLPRLHTLFLDNAGVDTQRYPSFGRGTGGRRGGAAGRVGEAVSSSTSASASPASHTTGPALTPRGIVKFADARWKTLKRLHIRNCRGFGGPVYGAGSGVGGLVGIPGGGGGGGGGGGVA